MAVDRGTWRLGFGTESCAKFNAVRVGELYLRTVCDVVISLFQAFGKSRGAVEKREFKTRRGVWRERPQDPRCLEQATLQSLSSCLVLVKETLM